MSHLHTVHDSDAHFTIDPTTREIKNESGKVTVIQHDHNSERFTFSIPRQVDGHYMSACNRVEIHYINIDATDKTKKATGVYEADDLKTSSDGSGNVTFSWLLSRNATRYAGSLNFLIRFACITNGVEEYAWHTSIHQGITVGSGMYYGGEEVIEPYLDVIAQWKTQLFEASDTAVLNVTTAETNALAAIEAAGEAKKQSVLDSIPDEYEALQMGVDTLFNSVASGIKGNLSGAVVKADDVSPVEHGPVVKVHGKNMFNVKALEVMPANYSVRISAVDVENNSFTITTAESHTGNGYCGLTNAKGNYVPTLRDLCPQLKVGKTYVLSGKTDSKSTFIYLRDISRSWVFGKPLTITEECLNAKIAMYGLDYAGGEGIGDCVISNIQIEEGTTTTEYTPYIDPSTVTVKRCGKNLAYQNDFAISGIAYSSGSIGGLGYTVLVKDIKITKGESYIISMDKPTEVTTPRCFLYNGNLSALTHTAAYNEIVPNKRGVERVVSSDAILATGEYEHIAITTGGASTFAAGEVNFEIKKLQLEIGNSATAFEPYKGADHTSGADGTVSGVTSVSPTITIMTDTPGVTVDCEYIVDTKTYIDNKIAEALKGSEQV